VTRGPDAEAPAAKQWTWRDREEWPLAVTDYATGLDLIHSLWTRDRAYSIQDLTQMAQARFELSRKRRVPGHYYRMLRKLERSWAQRERARAQ